MLKFLIILVLIAYLFYKVGGFLFRTLFMSASQFQQQQQRHYKSTNNTQQGQSKKAPDSNLNIDYVPRKQRRDQDGKINGGDYVDFEEVD